MYFISFYIRLGLSVILPYHTSDMYLQYLLTPHFHPQTAYKTSQNKVYDLQGNLSKKQQMVFYIQILLQNQVNTFGEISILYNAGVCLRHF